ncbi:ImmA/IrrE family metallo-endopeptidase [Sinomonas sp. P47F7]|uniref:ImmA/IrrE family metallo-endopeptidase n=1 Tax=Sinomonas sp. P47F7 TaxID=3410987 RepID=UPI003BF610F8
MHGAWGILRGIADISLFFVTFPDGLLGCTDGMSRIWLDKRLNSIEQRCTAMHELIHIENGHTGCQGARVERRVREEAARRLIPLDQLAEALAWTQSPAELADELHVTQQVIGDRLDGLTGSEREQLAAGLDH